MACDSGLEQAFERCQVLALARRIAAAMMAGTAALAAVDAVAPLPGETVLVSGATGGVGAFAGQLAAARGAYVISTARPGDEAWLRDLGTHHTVDDAATSPPRWPPCARPASTPWSTSPAKA